MNRLPPLQEARILIVDDEPANVALLRTILRAANFERLESTTDPRRAMALFHQFQPDIVLLDLMMPYVNGYQLLEQFGRETEPGDCLPVVVLTADVNPEARRRALSGGAADFLTKPFDQTEALLRIGNHLRLRAQHRALRGEKDTLEDAVRARTAELRETLTQLQGTRQQVIQHERLSALGSMAAGIAHDFNNRLSLILGYGELLLAEMADCPEPKKAVADDYLGVIISEAQDASKMFERLRDFHRPAGDGQPARGIDLNALAAQAVALTRPRWRSQAQLAGATIRVRTDPGKDLPPLTGDAAEVRELLANLIFNAVDAMPKGGTITLRTRTRGGSLALEVSDTGVGMSEVTRQRCLEPFFTTKGERGTGLGLAMVYGAVQRQGGDVAIHSTPGRGTTFCLTWPVRPPEAAVPAVPAAPAPPVEPLRILAVDDQPVLREILRQSLTADWHEVETAASAKAALGKLGRRRGGGFDLVIADMAMPGMNGDELARQVREMRPATKIILLTGFAPGVGAGGASPGAGAGLAAVDLMVGKPVTRGALRDAIRRVMAGA